MFNVIHFYAHFREQDPPEAMLHLHDVAEQDPGWLLVVASMIRVIPLDDPLGPATISLLLDECPLPSRELLQGLTSQLELGVVDWSGGGAKVGHERVRMHHNVAIVLGCLAEKLAGSRSIYLLSDKILAYLVGNLVISLKLVKPQGFFLISLLIIELRGESSCDIAHPCGLGKVFSNQREQGGCEIILQLSRC